MIAYSRRWNLVGLSVRRAAPLRQAPGRDAHAPLVHAESAAFAVIRKTLHLRQTIDAIIDTNLLCVGLRTPYPSPDDVEM